MGGRLYEKINRYVRKVLLCEAGAHRLGSDRRRAGYHPGPEPSYRYVYSASLALELSIVLRFLTPLLFHERISTSKLEQARHELNTDRILEFSLRNRPAKALH
jgi:hypothetical protein